MITLRKLINSSNLKIISSKGNLDVSIKGIAYHSKDVKDGYLFVCLNGEKTSGKFFVKEALKKGAKAIVSDEKLDVEHATLILVDDPAEVLSKLSCEFFNHPSSSLLMIGITGTNGKTTISYLLESIFSLAGIPSGIIGTINYKIGNKTFVSKLTTPQSSDLQYFLHLMVKEKLKAAIMEVSSHALKLNRVDGCQFDIAIFTNLSREHLDFHKDMQDYFNSKLKLFLNLEKEKIAIINNDDPWGRKIMQKINVRKITYGIHSGSEISAEEIKLSLDGISFIAKTPNGKIKIDYHSPALFNVYNILAAIGCALTQNIPPDVIKEGIESARPIKGRLEKIDLGQNFEVFIDYAHTPAALENILTSLKNVKKNKIITVFGCGGDRDKSKRPIMGRIASEMSDFVVLTSDNPRSEDPEKILKEIHSGVTTENCKIIVDRREAIKYALGIAEKDDIVLIAGKGHEEYQIIGDKKLPFSDSKVVKEVLSGKSTTKGIN